MESFTSMIIYFSVGIIFLIAVAVFFRWRRNKHRRLFAVHWELLKVGIDELDQDKIVENGKPLLWNDNMQREHYDALKNVIGKLNLENKEVESLKAELYDLLDKKSWLEREDLLN